MDASGRSSPSRFTRRKLPPGRHPVPVHFLLDRNRACEAWRELVQTRDKNSPERWGSGGLAMAKERHTVAFVIGAALGGAVGAIYGLMNAPRPGAQTRADLTERWHDVSERTAQEIANLETEVRDRVAPEWSSHGRIDVRLDSPART